MTLASYSIAMARFGLGTSMTHSGDAGDARAALLAELDEQPAMPRGRTEHLESSAALAAMVRNVRTARRDAKGGDDTAYKQAQEVLQGAVRADLQYRIAMAKAAPTGVVERLVAFWSNHFAIAAKSNALLRGVAGAYEREAIRPYVLGRFGDMLLAVTQHPAMLTYLNNDVSVGPGSRLGLRREKGLNENHARELMELHTLGVDGGYDQADVTNLAKVLTGWSIAQGRDSADEGTFQFRQQAHEPGPQTVMGQVYDQRGIDQGAAVLADLASAPATARHIATKLVRHFVADEPDPALVASLDGAFLESGGDLKVVTQTLLQSDLAWAPERAKLRSPQEFVWAAMRALDVNFAPNKLNKMLDDLGQGLWNPPSPAGYSDSLATWLAPGGMTTRLEVAQLLAADAKGPDDPRDFAKLVFGDAVSEQTLLTISRAESRSQGLALMLMSPEFQRR
ncbi:MAG: DUF1800 domain-containing protein [Cypionkella sp.]